MIDLYRTWYEVLASTDHRWAILTGHDVSSNFYYEYLFFIEEVIRSDTHKQNFVLV